MGLISVILGLIFGFIIGLIPGFHINSFIPIFPLLGFADFSFALAASVAFVFSSVFPSVLFGVPNNDTNLNVFSAHKLVLQGRAYEALQVSFCACLIASLLSIFTLLLLIFFINSAFELLNSVIVYLLCFVLIWMSLNKNVYTLLILLLSSLLGILTMNNNVLLPMLSGFFALSTLIYGVRRSTNLPNQFIQNKPIFSFELVRICLLSSVLSVIFSLIPSVSSSITASFSKIFGKLKLIYFVAFVCATNMSYMIFSFFTLLLIGKTRSGSAVYAASVFNNESILLLIGVILFSSVIAYIVSLKMMPIMINAIVKINYFYVNIVAICFIVAINIIFAGFFSLLVLVTSTSIGLLCMRLRVKRINCIASLIVPTILLLMSTTASL